MLQPKRKDSSQKKAEKERASHLRNSKDPLTLRLRSLEFTTLIRRWARLSKWELVRKQEAAEICLAIVMNSFNQFPPVSGCQQITSWTGDIEQEATDSIYYVYNSNSVIGIRESGSFDLLSLSYILVDMGSIDSKVLMTVRDCSGKFTWESQVIYSMKDVVQPTIKYLSYHLIL